MHLRRFALGTLVFLAWLGPALMTGPTPLIRGVGEARGCTGTTSTGQAGIMISPGLVLDAFSLRVDEKGTAGTTHATDPTGKLTRDRLQQAKKSLNADVAKASPIRKVSLTRLERALQGQLDKNHRPTDEMLRLAGLTRIRYVFFYPDSGDIVVAGPAEGWFQDLTGRFIGMATNRPTLELQDLVVALRAFGPDKDEHGVVSCSIDPTPEGLARMQKFLSKINPNPEDAPAVVEGLRTSLGLQKVRISGVSPDTHFAQVMVEADYRMKLIGIGAEQPGITKFKSFAELADPAQIKRSALIRWWFVPQYDCVCLSEDHLAMELVGDAVKLVGEDEVVGANGQRMGQGKSGRASQLFTKTFTQKYAELAKRKPIYAQLRNLIDMAVVAAHIQREGYYAKAGWSMEVLGNEELFPVQVYKAPVEVDTVVTSMWKNNTLVTPVGGGVRIEAEQALESANLLPDEEAKVAKAREALDLSKLADNQWWWD
ncbi:MAG TPA: DUF1598 domain-containing protein [Pirellulales bacterium]|jgi:hypothetical protein|nr:DUF1598 domain-containing protein [Pirellulales bacterium]